MAKPCEWCGHAHDVTALCTKRPKWSRRGFLALMGAAAVGAALPSLPGLTPPSTICGWAVVGPTISADWAKGIDWASIQPMLFALDMKVDDFVTPEGQPRVAGVTKMAVKWHELG